MRVEARLRAFAAVARQRSFSRAAEELYVTQPAVSKHVASLEAELGTQLVVRDRRALALTPAGEVLADYVLRAEALLANARRALATGADAETGTLSLAGSSIPGTYLLPSLLAHFHAQQPAVELDFHLATSADAMELVRTHRVELAVLAGQTAPPELESEPLLEDEVVLVGPVRLAGRRLRARELEGETWIARDEGPVARAAMEAARWQVGLGTMRTLELPSWEAVKLAVASGAGIAAISRCALEAAADATGLAVLDVPRWRLTSTISLVTARDVPLTPTADRFRGMLRDAFLPRAEPAPNSNLPVPATALLGRAAEMAATLSALRGGEGRLVTLTGPGGSGKTRLAIEAAAALVDEVADGVYFVPLARLREPDLVRGAIAGTVGVADADDLDQRLRERELVLVLDNLEQLVAAAGTIAELLAAAPRLRILATSRVPLRIAGEQELRVEPLELADAVALFEQRARAVRPGFVADDSLATVCRRLDCLPLALELAAARVRTLPAAVLAEGLHRRLGVLVGGRRDADERQRTLRATIAWSYDLLAPPERTAFARLAVFAGGCDHDAALEVCDVDGPTVNALADDGLLVATPDGRVRMLELVREFADDELVAGGDERAYRRRHAEHCLALAHEARPHARGPQEKAWLDRLVVELDNLRAALRWAVEEAPELGLELAEALEPLWVRGQRHREGLRWLEPLLSAATRAPADVLAGALALAGRLSGELGDLDRARPLHERALALAREAGDERRAAWALHGLGDVAREQGELDLARELLEESLALFVALGELGPAAGRLSYLATVATEQGDMEAARGYWEASRDRYAAAGDRAGVAGSVHGLGDVALWAGDPDGALTYYVEALEAAVDMDDRTLAAHCLAGLAAVLAMGTRDDEAARLWGAAQRAESELDVGIGRVERARYERVVGEPDPDAVAAGRRLTAIEALELVRAVA
jgi:predicted ATPase/DNA-binding transcriptional LysR family regulator